MATTNSPARCPHGVLLVNPATMTSWCSGCATGVVSSGPRWTAPTVHTFSAPKPVFYRRFKKDKPWVGTPAKPVVRRLLHLAPLVPPLVRPTGMVILVPPTVRTIPYNTVTNCESKNADKLVPDINWQSRTVGRELDAAFDAVRTLTSLDKDFSGDGSPELNHDGDDIAPFEPTVSLTCNVPSSDIEHVEVVKLGRGPARSWKEFVPQSHHNPKDLSVLPPLFNDKKLGIRNRVDAFFSHAVVLAITYFNDGNSDDGDGFRNKRITSAIQRHAADWKPFVADGTFVSDHETTQVRERLAQITSDQVRHFRERWGNLHVIS